MKIRWLLAALCAAPGALVLTGAQGQAAMGVTSSTLTFGTITSASGTPLAGVTVTLVAEPVTMPLPGQTLALTPLATDVTDPGGNYTLNLPPNFTGVRDTDPSTGLISFNVLVDGNGTNVLSTVEASVTQASGASKVSTLHRTDFAGASATTTTTTPDSAMTADFTDTTPSPDSVISYGDTDIDPNSVSTKQVYVKLVKDLGRHWVAVGSWFSKVVGVSSEMEYSNGSNSTLGIGYSASGAYGSFHQSGTHTESSTATQGFPNVHNRQSILERTLFRYKEYRYDSCVPRTGCHGKWYEAQATSWSGGSDIQQTGSPAPFRYCVKEQAGSTWARSNTKASTWTNGVAIAKVIGIDLSTQTGYTAQATQHVAFQRTRRLCGWQQDPGQTPGLLMARPQ